MSGDTHPAVRRRPCEHASGLVALQVAHLMTRRWGRTVCGRASRLIPGGGRLRGVAAAGQGRRTAWSSARSGSRRRSAPRCSGPAATPSMRRSPSATRWPSCIPAAAISAAAASATIRLADGKETFFNFRETAPRRRRATCISTPPAIRCPAASTDGYKAVGVPGTVLGLETMRERYGTMSREALMAPAIALAEDGFVLADGDAAILAALGGGLRRRSRMSTAIFLKRRQAAAGRRPAGPGAISPRR